MKKYIFVIGFVVLLLFSIFAIRYCINNKIFIINNSLEYQLKMIPFTSDENLTKVNLEFKINENLPKIEAASAFYPFAANLVENIYNKEIFDSNDLKLVSTNNAYQDLISGNCDFIIASSPSDDQQVLINESKKEFSYVFLYYEPLVIFVNENNQVQNLNIDEIQNYYNYDSNLYNTYQLEENNGSQTCFESIVKKNIINKKHIELKTMPEIIDYVGKDEKGIGYAFFSYYTKMYLNENNTKIVTVNEKSITDEDYPLLFEVYLIYDKVNNNDNIDKLIEWFDTDKGNEFIQNIK